MPVRLGLKFAVVREDPELESHLISNQGAGREGAGRDLISNQGAGREGAGRDLISNKGAGRGNQGAGRVISNQGAGRGNQGAGRALLVASGGCTALSLLAEHADLEVTAFDLNPRQLEQVRDKAAAAAAGDLARLNVGDADERGLNQSGEFEGLFRTLRRMLLDFVVTERELETFFTGDAPTRTQLATTWTTHRYWPGCFAACFSDGLLHAMFGPAATQHAEPGSYPRYFAELFERGLEREDAARNPFLQHVLLGMYRPDDAPAYTRDRRGRMPELVLGGLDAVPDLERFDLFSLSNVFDWSDDDLVADWSRRLKRAARPGSIVLLRQLNNTRDLRRHFAPEFVFDDALGAALQARDRSLFYNRVEVGRRV